MLIPLTHPDDPRIEPYRAVQERDLTGRQGRFIAEGEVVLNVLLHSPYAVESLLISEKQLGFLDRAGVAVPDDVPVYVAEQKVMDAIVGFHIHRGLLAVGRKQTERSATELLSNLPAQTLALGLVGLSNHDNIGGIFRNAAAFGAGAVLLDDTCCDPLYRKALRVSVGGVLRVPFVRSGTAEEMICAFRANGFSILALSPRGDKDMRELAPRPGRTALLLGAEGPGLPEEILECVETVRIPMAGAFDSLNVATTSGIALHQLRLTP